MSRQRKGKIAVHLAIQVGNPEPLSEVSAAGFCLRGRHHLIAWRDGPERIEPEWWWDDPDWRSGPRDYWQAATHEGSRLWLFHTPGAREPGWYLHGVFA